MTPITVTPAERSTLQEILRRAEDVRRAARQLQAAGAKICADLDEATWWKSGLSHQVPADLWDAQARLDQLLRLRSRLLSQAVRDSGVVDEILRRSTEMEIVFRLTALAEDESECSP